MKTKQWPHTISSLNPAMSDTYWLQDTQDLSVYWFHHEGIKSMIVARLIKVTNRGITLHSFNLTGELLQFTLKPNIWVFED